uniref:BHLH domain-containing protein n=1 Tax=Oryza meridionalis TaxID=40149 RepID=A0A0E0DH92_9ORYZ
MATSILVHHYSIHACTGVHCTQLHIVVYFITREAPGATGWSLQPLLHFTNQPRRAGKSSDHTEMHALFAVAADTAFSSSPAADERLPNEHPGGHLWNQSVLEEEHGSNDDSFRESLVSLLDNTRDYVMAPEVFEGVPVACDYLKGMDSDGMAASAVAAYSLDNNGQHAGPGVSSIEHGIASSPPLAYQLGKNSALVQRSIQQQEVGSPMAAFLQQLIPTSVLDQSGIGFGGVCLDGSALEASFCMRTSQDVSSFSGHRSATAEELMSTDRREQEITRLARSCSSSGSDPKKKKISEVRGGGKAKKFKSETSHSTSSPKHQPPKVKLGEKITALQQIVSPFGKTDTASVLLETITYIKFLHEQIQLFSQPYMRNSTNKGHIHWGGEGKRKALEHELRGRGLCLVPVSWTSQEYCDSILPECWAPAYRNYFYR